MESRVHLVRVAGRWREPEYRRKAPPDPESLAIFSHATYWSRGGRYCTVSGNALDHSAIGEGTSMTSLSDQYHFEQKVVAFGLSSPFYATLDKIVT